MTLNLIKLEVGPWPMNAYLLVDGKSNTSTIVDPGADANRILSSLEGTQVAAIMVTHGHADHVGALDEIKSATHAPVFMNPIDAGGFNLHFDQALQDGQLISIGSQQLRAIHTPGHTPGQTSLDLGDGRILVGDTIFVGGPGKTWSGEDFAITMGTMQQIVFARPEKGLTGAWPDETKFYPGHGPSGVIGQERPAFEAFVARGWSPDLYGDVTWE